MLYSVDEYVEAWVTEAHVQPLSKQVSCMARPR